MKEVVIKGLTEVEGMRFHHIEGGFGENKRAMLVKEIAEIHNRDLGKINELINNNRKRFIDMVDIIDLKANPFEGLGYEETGYSKQSFNQSNNIYILSERGYAKLLKILEDDFAWEQYDKLVDGYFNMRKILKSSTNPNLSRLGDLASLMKEWRMWAKEMGMPPYTAMTMLIRYLNDKGEPFPKEMAYLPPFVQEQLPIQQINIFNIGE